jgi:AraC-like DNA-binding protein
LADPLSDVLALLDARSLPSAGLVAGGKWSVRVPAYDGLKFNAVVRGTAWLAVNGMAEPIHLASGDCFMLTKGSPFVLASDLDLPAVDAATVFADTEGGSAHIGLEEECVFVGGKMILDTVAASLLVDALPAAIHFSAGSERATSVRWLLERLQSERDILRPGGEAAAGHLIHVLFIELIRAHLLTVGGAGLGWIGALSDRRLGAVISALHEEPTRDWTLPELAALAHMSRSNFALRFRTQVGVPPLEYLTRWRMQLARHALVHRTQSVGEIAMSVGYASESAFGAAFKRIFGQTPRRYRSKPSSV